LLFFAGDMLMYGHFGAAADFPAGALAAVRGESLAQLFLGGLVGPCAALLCAIGFWHVFMNMALGKIRWAILGLSVFSMTMLGAVHVLWVAKGLLKRNCIGTSPVCQALTAQINDYWNTAYYVGVGPAYLACALLALAVLAGKTAYPRWTTAFNPALSLGAAPLIAYAPAPWGAPLAGGDANLFIAAFFLISLLSTWKPNQAA
jgi:hypothetical protein